MTTERTRRSRAELRRLLLDAAVELLHEEGLSPGVHELSYQRVFDHLDETRGVRVTRGSVHERIWRSQRDFQLEVLSEACRYRPRIDDMTDALTEMIEHIDISTSAGRLSALREISRVGGRANVESLRGDREWKLWVGVWAASAFGANDSEQIDVAREAVGASYNLQMSMMRGLYEALAKTLRLKPRPEVFGDDEDLAFESFTLMATSLVEGMALRRQFESDTIDKVELPTGEDGSSETWETYGLGFFLLADAMFVTDDG